MKIDKEKYRRDVIFFIALSSVTTTVVVIAAVWAFGLQNVAQVAFFVIAALVIMVL